jgi:tripartite-type tricarboxylate transporter receptor subunit TctC
VIAADAAAKSAPDGYTFLFCSNSTMASVPLLVANAPYQPERDFAPVGMVSRAPFFVVVPAGFAANTMAELMALARREPGKLSYGSNGNGTSGNLGMELLKLTHKLDIVHVPYRSYVPALNDMLGGRLDVMMADLTVVGGALQAGTVKLLAAAVPERTGFFPELPTVAEVTGIEGFDAGVWFGLFAPTGVPDAVVRRLNAETVAWLGRPETTEALRRIGQVPDAGTPEQLRATVGRDGARYARIIRETGVRID